MKSKLSALVVILTLTASVGASAQTKVVYGSWTPEGHPNAIAAKEFFKRVEQQTGDSIKFEPKWDGTVTTFRTTHTAVRDRLVDATYNTGSTFQAEFKGESVITEMTSIATDTRVVSAAATETALKSCPDCLGDLNRFKMGTLGYVADSPVYLMCKQPFTKLEELKGKSIRGVLAFGNLAQSWGATPVNTAPGEVFEAMQRGQVHCLLGNGLWLRLYGLWEVAKFVVEYPLGQYNNGNVFAMNRDAWRELSAAQKKAINDNAPLLLRTAVFEQLRQDREVREASIAKGVKWVKPSDEFVKHFQEFRKNEMVRAPQVHVAKGFKDAPGVFAAFAKNVEKWEKIVGEVGNDPLRYEEALKREIYSQVKLPLQ